MHRMYEKGGMEFEWKILFYRFVHLPSPTFDHHSKVLHQCSAIQLINKSGLQLIAFHSPQAKSQPGSTGGSPSHSPGLSVTTASSSSVIALSFLSQIQGSPPITSTGAAGAASVQVYRYNIMLNLSCYFRYRLPLNLRHIAILIFTRSILVFAVLVV